MLRRILVGAIAVGVAGSFDNSAQAFQLGQGADTSPNSYSSNGALIVADNYATPNSNAESNRFLTSLTNPTMQDFNSFALGDVTSLTLNFGSAGTGIFQGKGTITSDSAYPNSTGNQVLSTANSTLNPNPGTSGSHFDEISFSQPISAFGFSVLLAKNSFARSQTLLELTQVDGSIKDINVPINGTDRLSTVGYIDVTAQNLSEQFTKVKFLGASSRVQSFALSNITAATFGQIKASTPVPEPTSILGSGMAIAFGIVLRRKVKR